MIIGIDGSRAFLAGRTGTENYSYQLLINLSNIDIENQYLIYINKSQELRVKNLDWPENFRFKVIGLPRLWTQIGLAFRTFIDPIDVLFIPSHTLPLIRRPGLRTVITVHDLGAEYLPAFHQLKQILYLKLMTHYQIKTASGIISVSEATKRDLIKKIGVRSSKINVVYEGVDEKIFKKIPNDTVNDIVKKYDLIRGKYFLFVGTIQPRKNLERLIKAFDVFQKTLKDSEIQKVRSTESRNSGTSDKSVSQGSSDFSEKQVTNFKLVLVGGKGWKSDEIYGLPNKLGIDDKVRFLGRIPDEDMVGLYNGALGLTYPSLFEGFGLPILEAFACGCPVITSNTSSMPEVADKAAILVNPNEKEEILKAMRQINENDTLRLSLIKKGNERYKKFNWKTTAKQTIEILKEIITK